MILSILLTKLTLYYSILGDLDFNNTFCIYCSSIKFLKFVELYVNLVDVIKGFHKGNQYIFNKIHDFFLFILVFFL